MMVLSEWFVECIKPMKGKVGEEIRDIGEKHCIDTRSVQRLADKIKSDVTESFVIEEILRQHDFHNSWCNDSKYKVHKLIDGHHELVEIRPPKDDLYWHWCEQSVTDKKEMTAWVKGYHTCSSNVYHRYNELMLLIMKYLKQDRSDEMQRYVDMWNQQKKIINDQYWEIRFLKEALEKQNA